MLQKGFTDRMSHLNIAFIVTECIMTCIEEDDDLFLITLDAQKAFDKLTHEILFNKIYHDGITGDLWILLRNMAISSAHVGDETLMFPICAPSPDACRAFNIVLLYLLYSTDAKIKLYIEDCLKIGR
jgi:hypothetical protein